MESETKDGNNINNENEIEIKCQIKEKLHLINYKIYKHY